MYPKQLKHLLKKQLKTLDNMTTIPEENKEGLTKEQEAKIASAYSLKEEASITEEELRVLQDMFDTPEKFVLLRKMFQVITQEERGLVYPSPESVIHLDPEQAKEFAFQVVVGDKVQETIRQRLLTFYQIIRNLNREDMKVSFDEKNKMKFENKERVDAAEEKDEAEEHGVGENL